MGVIGKPIAQSKSPALHNPSLAAAGVDACYVPLLVNDINEFLVSPLFGADDYAGLRVTIPHKEDALKCCAEVDHVAAQIGAVNTPFVNRTFPKGSTPTTAPPSASRRRWRLTGRVRRSGEGARGRCSGGRRARRGLAWRGVYALVAATETLERAAVLAEHAVAER